MDEQRMSSNDPSQRGEQITLAELRVRLDCRQIAQAYGLMFKQRQGAWWTTRCPNSAAHAQGDRHPSFSVSAQGFKCFSANCGVSGDAFALIGLLEQLDTESEFKEILGVGLQLVGMPEDALRREPRWRRVAPSTRRPGTRTSGRPDERAYRPPSGAGRAERPARGARPDGHAVGRPGAQTSRRPDAQAPGRLSARRAAAPDMLRYMPTRAEESRFSLPPDHPRLRLMARIWEIVGEVPLGKGALGWLHERGIDPKIAWAHGCRDWYEARGPLRELFAETSADDLVSAGLATRLDLVGEVKRWAGLRSLDGERWARGIAIPVVHPGWPVAPLAWRWRLSEPHTTPQGRTFKALAPYGGNPSMPMLPLGMAPCGADALAEVARWPHLAPDAEQPRYAVVVAEGEPDWLSVAEVAARLETELYVVALGLVAMSGNFPPEAAALLDGAECVVCVMDRGRQPADPEEWPGGVKMVERIRGWMLHEARRRRVPFKDAWEDVSRRLRVSLQDDDNDINDLHRAGELEGLLVRLLDGHL
jgi:hypothetical protein